MAKSNEIEKYSGKTNKKENRTLGTHSKIPSIIHVPLKYEDKAGTETCC